MDGSPRLVSLVLADSSATSTQDRANLRVTEAREVASQWWPEVPSVTRAFGPFVIVRLLEVERAGDHWHVTYLAELSPESGGDQVDLGDLGLTPWAGSLAPADLRMPWAKLGGPADALGWANQQLDAVGLTPTSKPTQHKTWNLSSLWSIPHDDGCAWLKTLAPFGAHEGVVLDLLSEPEPSRGAIPTLLGHDTQRLLVDEMPGVDGFGATVDQRIEIVDALVDIQLASAPLVRRAVGLGVPDMSEGPMLNSLVAFVESRAALDARLDKIVTELPTRLAELHRCGLPTTIVHGDAHPGNARIGHGSPLVFDWADSFVGCPIWDVSRVLAGDDPEQRHVLDHWLNRWSEVPGASPRRAADLMFALAPLRAAWVYQGFLTAIEPSEQIYHRHDVPEQLRLALERW